MNYLSNFLKYDIFSKKITFFFQKEDKISTYAGLMYTFLYIGIILALFIYNVNDIFQRTDMRAYDSSEYRENIPFIYINNNNLYFAFGIESKDTSYRFVDTSIYYPKVYFINQVKVNGNFKITETIELETELCKKENFEKTNNKEFLSSEYLDNSYCLKDYNLTLKGGYKYDIYTYLLVSIYPCKNESNNMNHCKPKEIIDYYMTNGLVSLTSADIMINPNNFSSPGVPTVQNLYTNIDISVYKEYLLYYRIAEVNSDEGFFYQHFKTQRYIQFSKEYESISFRNVSEHYAGNAIASIYFRLDDLFFVQKRIYSKIYNSFAVTGGYMQLLSVLFNILSILIDYIYNLKLINGIFNFNVKDKKITMKIKSIKELNIRFGSKDLTLPKRLSLSNNNIDNMSNNGNNISKNSLIPNESSIENNSNIFRKISMNQEKTIKNKKINNLTNNKKNGAIIQKIVKINNIQNNDNVRYNNYIFRVGSFYPKFSSVDDGKKKTISLERNSIKLNINLFDFCCFKMKKKDIELYNLSLFLFKKRMDIINVFTLLLFAEKNLYKNSNNS